MKALFFFLFLLSSGVFSQPVAFNSDEIIFYFTTKINCVYKEHDKYFNGSGTGFFFDFDTSNNSSIPVIITNKHVIKDAVTGQITFRIASPSGIPEKKTYTLTLNNFENRWIMHPDTTVDLCVLPIATILQSLQDKLINIFFNPLSVHFIPTESDWNDFFSLQSIKMVGYPNGLWDTINHLPIVRTGITATPPYINFNGESVFLIDSPCFPGSSGSPVLIYDVGIFQNRQALIPASRIYLLGILYAGPQMTVHGDIVLKKGPVDKSAFVSTNIPINLGMVIKANQLLVFQKMLTRQ